MARIISLLSFYKQPIMCPIDNNQRIEIAAPCRAKVAMPPDPQQEVLFEFVQIGGIMRVTAVDVNTGTEVVIQGPAAAPATELRNVARSKLNFMLKKQQDAKR